VEALMKAVTAAIGPAIAAALVPVTQHLDELKARVDKWESVPQPTKLLVAAQHNENGVKRAMPAGPGQGTL
jgi:hypothetical protein